MKIVANYKIISKIVSILIVLVILTNFTIPNYIYATEEQGEAKAGEGKDKVSEGSSLLQNYLGKEDSINDQSNKGGALFTPITDFLIGISDNVMGTLQSVFLEDRKVLSNLLTADSIKLEGPSGGLFSSKSITLYMIKYSPAAIFAGNVPALDVNFFNPKGENGKVDVQKTTFSYNSVGGMSYETCKSNYGAPDSVNVHYDSMKLTEIALRIISLVCAIDAIEAIGNLNIGAGLGEVEVTIGSMISAGVFLALSVLTGGWADSIAAERQVVYWRVWQNENDGKMYFWVGANSNLSESLLTIFGVQGRSGNLYEITENVTTYSHNSTAYTLRNVIATWYNAFRTFALVALLSVLVYIGIRIILSSSSAESKAKYKKMLVDWVTAICLLFVLHYIMAFVLDFSQKITEIFKVTTLSEGGVDYFMTTIRNSIIQENGSQFRYWGYAIMYMALVILTVTFTFEYIKRLIFISLLTMIAPLIALTYPLDKIRDGQAQGFMLWLREYVFNCLIQPVHLLLYTMIVGTAIQTMKNPIIAIVALALFRPAEIFLRKLFGFDKATTMNNLGTIAGGAMIMNLLNKLPKGPKGGSKNGSGNSGKIRMNPNNAGDSGNNGGSINNTTSGNSGSTSTGGSRTSSTRGGSTTSGATFGNSSSNSGSSGGNTTGIAISRETGTNNSGSSINTTRNQSSGNGYRALGQKAIKNGVNLLASAGRWSARTAAKAGGAIAGATVGIAAGAADGEIGIPYKNIAAGAYGGAKAGEAAVGTTDKVAKGVAYGIGNEVDELKTAYEKGKMRDEGYKQSKEKEQFYKSEGWKKIENDSSISGNVKERTEEFLDNGIYDSNVIHEALQKDISGEQFRAYSDVGVESVNDMAELKKSEIVPQTFKEYQETGIASVEEMQDLKSVDISPTDYKEFSDLGIKDVKKISRVKSKHRSEKAANVASRMAIAQHGKQLISDPPSFVRFAKSVDPGIDAEALLREIGSYMI